jgi:ATP-binding cassette subfamily B protein
MDHRRSEKIKKKESPSWRKNFESLKYIPRFFTLIWQTNKWLFLANICVRLVKSILPVLMLWVGKLIIDEVVLQVDFSEKNFTELWFLLGLEFGLAVISNLFSRIISLTDGLLGDLYANKSSVELIQKSAKLELAQLEDSVFYDKLERARRQTTNRISLMSNVLSQGQDIITVISLITGLIVFEPWLIVLLFIAIIPSFINEIKFSRTSYSLQRSWTPERRELDYLRFIGASDQTAKEVKLFGLANYISTKFAEVAHRYYLANRKLSIQRSLWGSLFNIIGDVAYYWAYLVIIMQTVSGIITIGAMTFLSGSFSRLRGQLQTIFSRFSRITESAMYLQDYFDFIDIETEEDRTEVFQKIPEKIQTGFSFENVSFKYPESEKFVLKNITFSLKKGEKLALVGENGAGKTTLVKLLLRMYEPDEGRILLDGKDIRNYPKSEYQQLFGAIFQDFVKYYFTAGENIGIGYVKEI